jgi:hypothetical protein
MTFRIALPFALSLLGFAASASAGTLTSPPAALETGSVIGCLVQNLDSKQREVTARLVLADGSVLDEEVDLPVLPGAVLTVNSVASPNFGVYCQFEGLNKKLRGFLHLQEGDQTILLLPAAK